MLSGKNTHVRSGVSGKIRFCSVLLVLSVFFWCVQQTQTAGPAEANFGGGACASSSLDPSCKRDPKNFLQTGSEPRADTDRFNLFIDNYTTSLRLL